MGHSFRLSLLTSFILPMCVFIPLIGLAITYLLEYQVFLPALGKEMITEGNLLAQRVVQGAEGAPSGWANPAAAQAIIDRMDLPGTDSLYLLDAQGRLLATNQPGDRPLVGKPYPDVPVTGDPPLSGQWRIIQNGPGNTLSLEITVPLQDSSGQVAGQLRLVRQMADIAQGLREARDWIIAALLIGVLLNSILALILSARVTHPLRQITQGITTASLEGQPKQIEDQGLTELDSLAHAFNQLQERRYEIESTRKQMLANLVHELSRPLGSLQIAAHALLRGAESNANLRLDLLAGMAERIELMGQMVNDLALAYLPERSLNLRRLPFEPGPWLNSLVPLWNEMARHKGIEWHTSWPEQLPVIEGDPARLEQAIGNLVSNAIKFTSSGGRVSLSAGVDSGQFWVSVADNGPGIYQEDIQHLFDPFFRAERAALKAPGLGLGLSIAKTIVEAHGGTIEVHSHPGDGSRFTFCIPYHSESL